MILYKNNNQRLIREHDQLKSKNPELHDLIYELSVFAKEHFNKDLVITMIHRTDAEQDYLYRDSAKYARRKFKSPHQFWQAVDVRSYTFTQTEIVTMVNYLNNEWNSRNYYKWTAKCHEVGDGGMHFHIQFVNR